MSVSEENRRTFYTRFFLTPLLSFKNGGGILGRRPRLSITGRQNTVRASVSTLKTRFATLTSTFLPIWTITCNTVVEV